jgi:hypothetical protein
LQILKMALFTLSEIFSRPNITFVIRGIQDHVYTRTFSNTAMLKTKPPVPRLHERDSIYIICCIVNRLTIQLIRVYCTLSRVLRYTGIQVRPPTSSFTPGILFASVLRTLIKYCQATSFLPQVYPNSLLNHHFSYKSTIFM